MTNAKLTLITNNLQQIQQKIHTIRGQRVMLDRDLAALYGVETKTLNQAVKRNIKRFEGEDFMFQLTKEEVQEACLRSQIVTLNNGRGQHSKYLPNAFTELGVAMLSSVLKSETAISINREIMRAFVIFRHIIKQPMPDNNAELRVEIQTLREEMEEILADQNDINEETRAQLDAISMALSELQCERQRSTKSNPIGFVKPKETD
ncbi:MAG: ORF6N domain-containing protein [Bacteroidales bacterium]|nr:ORF6N domain-containing protein [Bacteroidales bacterium]